MPTIALSGHGTPSVPVTVTEFGPSSSETAYVVLHGGAGPVTVMPFAERLASTTGARVAVPVHPGFDGTERPAEVATVIDLAQLYSGLPKALGLQRVTVIGNSIGGWIAAEIGLLQPPHVERVVLVDAIGIEVADHPTADVSTLTPAEIVARSFFTPPTVLPDPASLSNDQRDAMAANSAALATYGGPGMADPTLITRLKAMSTPTLVVWGEADRIVDPVYGRAYAAAIPGARFVCLPGTGHLPQLETPDLLLATISEEGEQ